MNLNETDCEAWRWIVMTEDCVNWRALLPEDLLNVGSHM
jgi:hypothetical protein